jgi:hypothetical protein
VWKKGVRLRAFGQTSDAGSANGAGLSGDSINHAVSTFFFGGKLIRPISSLTGNISSIPIPSKVYKGLGTLYYWPSVGENAVRSARDRADKFRKPLAELMPGPFGGARAAGAVGIFKYRSQKALGCCHYFWREPISTHFADRGVSRRWPGACRVRLLSKEDAGVQRRLHFRRTSAPARANQLGHQTDWCILGGVVCCVTSCRHPLSTMSDSSNADLADLADLGACLKTMTAAHRPLVGADGTPAGSVHPLFDSAAISALPANASGAEVHAALMAGLCFNSQPHNGLDGVE